MCERDFIQIRQAVNLDTSKESHLRSFLKVKLNPILMCFSVSGKLRRNTNILVILIKYLNLMESLQ